MSTAHIAAYYWFMWKRSGGVIDWDGRPMNGFGNSNWFNLYWRECDACADNTCSPF